LSKIIAFFKLWIRPLDNSDQEIELANMNLKGGHGIQPQHPEVTFSYRPAATAPVSSAPCIQVAAASIRIIGMAAVLDPHPAFFKSFTGAGLDMLSQRHKLNVCTYDQTLRYQCFSARVHHRHMQFRMLLSKSLLTFFSNFSKVSLRV
jgi:hypothetical protein